MQSGTAFNVIECRLSVRRYNALVGMLMLVLTCLVEPSPVNGKVREEKVSFSRDILPILSDRCFHCHGPDEGHREANLRLDREQDALADLGGYAAIVPGDPTQSELWRRITTADEDEMMPPPDSHRPEITAKEREKIRRWIVAGALWGRHWAFEKPVRPDLPRQVTHPIDALILRKLSEKQLQPQPLAAPHTLARRLAFDLTGMAPSPEAVKQFLSNPNDENWQAYIEATLKSPHYGQRMAMWWLDAARYSDSDGYQQDETRQNWPWRDWVIQQFQDNRPFDEFTREQFAGDLLPDATDDQILATCFHRNHMTNGEGGRDPEESRVDYVIDRVNTTGTVWLGLTLGCAQCHSHKFDPVSQHDYYALSAFFNSIDEDGRAGMNAKPYLAYTSPRVAEKIQQQSQFVKDCEQSMAAERTKAEQRFAEWLLAQQASPPMDYSAWSTLVPSKATSTNGTGFEILPDGTVQTTGPQPFHDDYKVTFDVPEGMTEISGWRLEVLPHESHVQKRFTRYGNGDFTLTSAKILIRRKNSPSEIEIPIKRAVADFERKKDHKSKWDPRYAPVSKVLNDDARDGWTTAGSDTQTHVGVFELESSFTVAPGDQLVVLLRHLPTHGNANIGRFRISWTTEAGETPTRVDGGSPMRDFVAAIAEGKEIDEPLKRRLLRQHLAQDKVYQRLRHRFELARRQLERLKKEQAPRKVMVLKERTQKRDTHVLERGVWNAKGDKIDPGILTSILELENKEPLTRLDLANWIVDEANPLTARVVVNHLWQIMFGAGIVRTPEDFGLQGEFPTHPELLDWLAVELMENDWDIQHILRLIATSETYRRSSIASPVLKERDPENRWLARASRFRLPAWMLRDNALQVSGLLNDSLGGPPVYPYQPSGIWSDITMGRFRYEPSLGPAQYRRTIFSFWRRSSAPAFLFDSAQRRVCETGIRRTNTPLHALTLLNDLTMLESSRALADTVVQQFPGEIQTPSTIVEPIDFLTQIILSRKASSVEVDQMKKLWLNAFEYYSNHLSDAKNFVDVGQRAEVPVEQIPSTAAWMVVASTMLNFDESLNRE